MGMFLIRLNKVVLLFKNCPSINLTLVLSNSNKGFLPHHTPRRRLLNVVFFFTGIPPRPLMMALGSKALFFATFFRLFSFLWFCRRRRFGDTFLLHPVRLFFLREGFDGLRHRRCFCRGGEYCSSRHGWQNEHDTSSNRAFLCPKTFCTSGSFACFLLDANAFLMP